MILENMRITSPFGFRGDPINGVRDFHSGTDLSAAIGTPIYALSDGIVKISKVVHGGIRTGYGNYVVTEHDGYCMLIAHLDRLELTPGQKVYKGTIIGHTGSTGRSTGPHLHVEIRECKYDNNFFVKDSNGMYYKAVDPIKFIDDLSKPEFPQWQEDLIQYGLDEGIITSYHKPDEIPPYWALMSMFKNLIERDKL